MHIARGGDKIFSMTRTKKFDFFGSAVLGMHDAVVSITGTIAGLTFTLTNRRLILLTCIIMSVVDAMSMTAANYLAAKTDNNRHAKTAGFITGGAYMITSILLLVPFAIFTNMTIAFIGTILITLATLFGFNLYVGLYRKRDFIKPFLEMLTICTIVSLIAFIIGQFAKTFLGIDV